MRMTEIHLVTDRKFCPQQKIKWLVQSEKPTEEKTWRGNSTIKIQCACGHLVTPYNNHNIINFLSKEK